MAQQQRSTVSMRHHWSFRVWPQLPSELAERIVESLDCNEISGTFRHLNKATAEHFSGPEHTTIHLTEPVPPHAFAAHWLTPGAMRGLTLERRRKLVRLVAASGVLPNMEVALQAAGFVGAVAAAFMAAAGAGQLPMCQWLWDFSRSRTDDLYDPCRAELALEAAAFGGHRHVCEWLLAIRRSALHSQAINAAVEGGHVALAEWLLQQHPSRIGDVYGYMGAVAHGCDLPTLQRAWLLHFGRSLDLDKKAAVLSSAAGSPTPDWAAKVEWLEAKGCPRSAGAAMEAAGMLNNDSEALARLTWLRGRGYPVNVEAAAGAATRSGNTAAVRYLLAEVPEGTDEEREDTVHGAAEAGHLAALQALHAAGWPLHRYSLCLRDSTLSAARHGHLHVLAWLLDTLGPELVVLDAGLFAAAAKSGNMELLAWLRQHGCLWDFGAYSGAAEAGWVAALEWLAEQDCPMEECGDPYTKACRNGDLATARCLRRLGAPWGRDGSVFIDAASEYMGCAPRSLLRWLLGEGCPVDVEDVEEVEDEEVLRLVREHLGRRQPQHG
ncbi:hypothetical protein GPECTOR_47g334 [Gonium pectorale]|uniref:Uncharacterized protein n=1 Tax=Gonium pectorale TaxID=33097 RepID=A0A150G877_GONPE|nr:hypothetical protein GPECTOR_47g334 [Gonium pectorale]|eukprot:KXZ46059.1 hypothetical protein GPECTOR_47g334 [Gonium pectorale]